MHTGTFVFTQVMEHLPMRVFDRLVRKYHGHQTIKKYRVGMPIQ